MNFGGPPGAGTMPNMIIGGPNSQPRHEHIDFAEYFGVDEPSAVDQLAAIEDPDGPAAARVTEWNRLRGIMRRVAETEMKTGLIDRVTVDNL